jgi:hypothetical protein
MGFNCVCLIWSSKFIDPIVINSEWFCVQNSIISNMINISQHNYHLHWKLFVKYLIFKPQPKIYLINIFISAEILHENFLPLTRASKYLEKNCCLWIVQNTWIIKIHRRLPWKKFWVLYFRVVVRTLSLVFKWLTLKLRHLLHPSSVWKLRIFTV